MKPVYGNPTWHDAEDPTELCEGAPDDYTPEPEAVTWDLVGDLTMSFGAGELGGPLAIMFNGNAIYGSQLHRAVTPDQLDALADSLRKLAHNRREVTR